MGQRQRSRQKQRLLMNESQPSAAAAHTPATRMPTSPSLPACNLRDSLLYFEFDFDLVSSTVLQTDESGSTAAASRADQTTSSEIGFGIGVWDHCLIRSQLPFSRVLGTTRSSDPPPFRLGVVPEGFLNTSGVVPQPAAHVNKFACKFYGDCWQIIKLSDNQTISDI